MKRAGRITALWLSLALPVLALMGCSSANKSRFDGTFDAPTAHETPARAGQWQQPQRPSYTESASQPICTPSDELAVVVAYGIVDGVTDTAENQCSVYYKGASRIDYSVAVRKPDQCTPDGLAALGHKLPKMQPVCTQ